MTRLHKHHIIPKHMGGSDDPSNLESITIEEHAQRHYDLWKAHGKEADRIAYLSLKGQLTKSEIIHAAKVLGGKNRAKNITKEEKSQFAKKFWSKPGMREHLSKKRKEQSKSGNNPMQGKTHKRVCCIKCRKEFAINNFGRHLKKCLG